MRAVLLVMGSLSAPTGAGMLWLALREQNPRLRQLGLLYVIGGVACLALWTWLTRRRTPIAALREAPSPGTQGMALPLSLALMALLSGTALCALVAAGADMRFSRQRYSSLELRGAAEDAAWSALSAMDDLTRDRLPFHSERSDITAAGIETRTSVRELNRTSLPLPLRRQDAPLFGRVFTVRCNAAREGQDRSLQALACLTPAGELRVLSWNVPP